MPEPLDADLELSITEALSSVDDLGTAIETALATAVASFEDEFTKAIAGLPPVESTIEVGADIGAAEEQLTLFEREADATDAVISVTADTGDAEQAVSDLAASVEDASSSVEAGATSNKNYGDSLGVLTGGAALARGEVGGASTALGVFAKDALPAAGAATAVGASLGFLYEKGVSATGALQRFDMLVGDMAGRVLNVKVGSLNAQLDELAIKLGTDDEALRNANASVFQFAINSGASRQEAAQFANNLTALAARGVALKPSLGGVDTAVESLSVRLARGARFAMNYGISLTPSEINTHALEMTSKSAAGELTIYEKSVAAADLAINKYGADIQKNVNEGSTNAIIVQRSLREQLDNVFEALGKPLVSPMFSVIRSAIPLAGEFGKAFSAIGTVALPVIATSLQIVAPLIQPVVIGLTAMYTIGTIIPFVMETIAGAAILMGNAFGVSANASLAAAAKVEVASQAMHTAAPEVFIIASLLVLAATSFGLFGSSGKSATEVAKGYTDQIAKANDASIMRVFAKDVRATGIAMAESGEHTDANIASMRAFRVLADEDVGAATRLVGAMRANGDSTDAYERVLARAIVKQREEKVATDASKAAGDAARISKMNSVDAAVAHSKALDDERTALDTQIAALDRANTALLATYDKKFASIHADETARDAIDKLATAYDDEMKSSGDSAKAQDAQARAQVVAAETSIRAAAQAGALALSNYHGADAAEGQRLATQAQIAKLEEMQSKVQEHGPVWQALEDYKFQLQTIPPEVKTEVEIETANALAALDALDARLRGIPNLQFIINADAAIRRQLTGAAAGAIVPARPGGTPMNIAEAGATEIVVPTNDYARAAALLRQGGLGSLLGSQLPMPRSMPMPSMARDGDRYFIDVRIDVSGTVDRDTAREVGREAAGGFADGLAKRGIVLAARTGGG